MPNTSIALFRIQIWFNTIQIRAQHFAYSDPDPKQTQNLKNISNKVVFCPYKLYKPSNTH